MSKTEGDWKGTVGVAEHLGSDTFMHIHGIPGCDPLTVRAGGEVDVRHGDTVHLTPRPRSDPQVRRARVADCMKRLDGKSALITGAARGIGKGFAKAYVNEGATVAIGDINIEAAEATADEIGDAAFAVQIDVSKQDSIDARH